MILRNQAISIIILIGSVGTILIYFQARHYYLLDFMAFQLPLLASDMIGFSNIKLIILHRLIFIALGFALYFATILFIDRLPQKNYFKIVAGLTAFGFLIIFLGLFFSYLNAKQQKESSRLSMVALNDQFAGKPNIDLTECDLSLTHAGYEIRVAGDLTVRNNHAAPLKEIFFTLNPSLIVKEVMVAGKPVDFRQNLQIISIRLLKEINPGEDLNIKISYQGSIDESIAYLDASPEKINFPVLNFFYRIEKRFAFLQPDYVLLTREVCWYPSAEVGFNHKMQKKSLSQFIKFGLNITTDESLYAISQGKVTNPEPGTFLFHPEYLLPQISLTIGDYSVRDIVVDSVAYQLFHRRDNDYFTKYFDQLPDTMDAIIRDLKFSYENEQKLKYHFNKVQLVETPIQFYSFYTLYENHHAFVQPEITLFPENGGFIRELDIKRQFRNINDQAKRNNQVRSEKDKQTDVLKNIVKRVLTKQVANDQYNFGNPEESPNYSLFPNVFNYLFQVQRSEWPLLQTNLTKYLNQDKTRNIDYSRNWRGISWVELCNLEMQEKNLQTIINEEEDFSKIQSIVAMKGDYLFSFLSKEIGEEKFKGLLYELVENNIHEVKSFQELRDYILQDTNVDIDPIIKQVYGDENQPAYVVSDLIDYEVEDAGRSRYQVIFQIKNIEDVDGVIDVHFDFSNDGGFFRPENNVSSTSYHIIPANSTKELHFILDEKPNRILINTLISKNIPSIIDLSLQNFELNNKAVASEGEFNILPENDVGTKEIIVDNEDPGFSTFSPTEDPLIRKLLQTKISDKLEDKYYGIWRRSQTQWRPTTGSAYFGRYIKSAHFTRSGNGEKTASWTVKLDQESFYDVYVYLTGYAVSPSYGNNKNDQINYRYTIYHEDGEDEISVNVAKALRGWNYIGTYYFTEGNSMVSLNDKCETGTVIADAVKWVKQQ